MKKDLCWEKSFVRNSYNEVLIMDFLWNTLYEAACSLNRNSCFENRLFLLYMFTLIYVHLICTPLNICAYLLYMPILQIGFSLLFFKQVGS